MTLKVFLKKKNHIHASLYKKMHDEIFSTIMKYGSQKVELLQWRSMSHVFDIITVLFCHFSPLTVSSKNTSTWPSTQDLEMLPWIKNNCQHLMSCQFVSIFSVPSPSLVSSSVIPKKFEINSRHFQITCFHFKFDIQAY